jgi:phosphoribosylformylglycinamidine (FGAM) synthase PurS component
VPHERRLRADGAEGPRGVSIVVRAREDDDGARAEIQRMCEELLANPLIESFEIRLEES